MREPDLNEIDRMIHARRQACKKCRGTGFSVKHGDNPLFAEHVRCSCSEDVLYESKLITGNIPLEFRKADSLEFEWNTKIVDAVRSCNMKKARREGRGFLFLGENGVGKTACASLWLIQAARAGYEVGFITAYDYVSNIIRAADDYEFGAWFNELVNAQFLVIDELGKEHRKGTVNEFSQAALDSLLRDRRGANLPTTICSNHDVLEIKEKYGESIWSLMSDRYKIMLFDDGDFRKQKGRR